MSQHVSAGKDTNFCMGQSAQAIDFFSKRNHYSDKKSLLKIVCYYTDVQFNAFAFARALSCTSS